MSDELSRRQIRKDRRDLRRNKALIAAIHQETDAQRADVASRTGTMHTRASILIAAASLSTALQVGQQGPWFVGAVWLSVTSAILGALVLLPGLGDQLNIEQNEKDLWGQEPTEFSRDLMHQKWDLLREDEKALFWRRNVLLTGYAALALSLAAAAIHLSTNINSEPEPNAPETVVTSTPTT
ncbi:hypothetical protein [Arthrobacter sp. B1805]|uniref:hypothetical protein n=1 Tax=Arthrobacter sp. B1805 TaxID=2058892 RepID=UPI0011B037DB|nr:hypothetical protein [Arthrobacter sp. B1805]